MTKTKTVRFWEYHHGIVRIKLSAGQSLHHSHGGRTEEGWTRESRVFSFDGKTVSCQWETDGADCDGRLTRGGIAHCSGGRLAKGYRDNENGATFPDWQPADEFQRDHSAEAAGY